MKKQTCEPIPSEDCTYLKCHRCGREYRSKRPVDWCKIEKTSGINIQMQCGKAPPRLPQAGRVFKGLLLAAGITRFRGCLCDTRERRMNAWGFVGSWKHRHEIYGWMQEYAGKHEAELVGRGKFFVLLWKALFLEDGGEIPDQLAEDLENDVYTIED